MNPITIKDIARICGVGVSTVSRAMNDHQDINPETKEKIKQVIAEYGYVPNNSARNLKLSDAATIAILVKGLTNPFFTDMIQIIENESQKRKYSVELRHVGFDEDEVEIALGLTKEKKLRGIVFLGGFFYHSEEKLENLGVPFVMATVGCAPANMKKELYSSYTVDDEKEGYKVTKYLIENGHRDIAILCGERENTSVGQLRLAGYKKALEEANIPIRDELICPMKDDIEYYTLENGYETMKDLLKSGAKFTAVFAISDILAIGACKAIREYGLSIPDDVSIIGYDGIEMGEYISPALSTLKQPVLDIALASSELIFDMIEGKTKNQHRLFDGEIIIRDSIKKLN